MYTTLNLINPELLYRAHNRVIDYAQHATQDADTLQRRWLPIDFDSVRPAGVSSSDRQHTAALARMHECAEWLRGLGITALILADSGNGGHMLVRIELPNTEAATQLVKRCLEAVALKFSDESVSIDLSVWNSGQVWKCYGTTANKGDAIPGRSHREARILEVAEDLTPVSRELLEVLAAFAPQDPSAEEEGSYRRFDLTQWLAAHHLDVQGPSDWKEGKKWIFPICPFNPAHTNKSAYLLQLANGAIAMGCHHNGCHGKNWHALRDLVEPGWREAHTKQESTKGTRGPSQATQLVKLAADAKLFHSPVKEPWARLQIAGHYETWPLKTYEFREWLGYRFHQKNGHAASTQGMQDALTTLAGMARWDGPERQVYTRVAGYEGRIYYDLATPSWDVVEITPTGWKIIQNPPVVFRHTRAMLPCAIPVEEGTLEDLKPFVNVAEDDWILVKAWLVMTLSPEGPYPVLELNGEHGSAKTSLARILRAIVDPSDSPVRRCPRDDRELFIYASANLIVALDNLSGIPWWLSDTLCVIASGGGYGARTLWTNDEETIFQVQRPIVLTGIENLAERGDLLDRTISLTLKTLSEEQYKSEKPFFAEVAKIRSRVLGALLTAASEALKNLPMTVLKRMDQRRNPIPTQPLRARAYLKERLRGQRRLQNLSRLIPARPPNTPSVPTPKTAGCVA